MLDTRQNPLRIFEYIRTKGRHKQNERFRRRTTKRVLPRPVFTGRNLQQPF